VDEMDWRQWNGGQSSAVSLYVLLSKQMSEPSSNLQTKNTQQNVAQGRPLTMVFELIRRKVHGYSNQNTSKDSH